MSTMEGAAPADESRSAGRGSSPDGALAVKCILGITFSLVLYAGLWTTATAREDDQNRNAFGAWVKELQSSMVLDGTFVHQVGELQLNITNWGLIGSRPLDDAPFSYAPSAMWPAGSGDEYLYAAGLWVGAIRRGTPLVSTGQPENEFLPGGDPRDTIYRTSRGAIGGERYPYGAEDDDGDGVLNEDPLDGYDNDRDGQIDEDFAAISNQHFRLRMRDNEPLSEELWPSHEPLGVEITQESYQWSNGLLEDAVLFEITVKNISDAPLSQVAVGLYADADIGTRTQAGASQNDMVGFHSRTLTAPDGLPLSMDMAYMYDCGDDAASQLGAIGFLFISTTDPPTAPRISSFQHFVRNVSFEDGGAPTNDQQRYEALTNREIDRVPPDCSDANDYRVLISVMPGAASFLRAGQSFTFQMAIVMGSDVEDLVSNAQNAVLAYYGRWFDRDRDRDTGQKGRETKVCLEDFGPAGPANPIYTLAIDCGDPVLDGCEGNLVIPNLVEEPELDDDGCVWINNDCAYEFSRGRTKCACYGFEYDPYTFGLDAPCTGRFGLETNVRWISELPVPSPSMRVWPRDNRVHVYWMGDVEDSTEPVFGLPNFESYQIWRATGWDRPYGSSIETGPATNLWGLLAEYDKVSSIYEDRLGTLTHLGFGANTGLEPVRYTPVILRPNHPLAIRYQRLRRLVRQIVAENTELLPTDRIRVRDRNGAATVFAERYPDLWEWVDAEAQVDTVAWDALGIPFYEYVDRNVYNGHYYFYSVGTTSIVYRSRLGFVYPSGAGLASSPRTNFVFTSPQSEAQSAADRQAQGHRIYVVPNPATTESLEEFGALRPNQDDPSGYHVEFRNLPRARNVLRIFTLAGDLVMEMQHDGLRGDGAASWNLVSRNGQLVGSGIYLYSVESAGGEFERVVGRFVVVR